MDLEYALDRIRALTGSKFDAVVVTALIPRFSTASFGSALLKCTCKQSGNSCGRRLSLTGSIRYLMQRFPNGPKQHQWFLNALKRKNALYCRIDVWGL